MHTNLEKFIDFCQQVQPYSQAQISRFFAAVVGFPYDKELLLQAYLYFHVQTLFPDCRQLLLFEQSLVQNRTDLGKRDLVYLTHHGSLFFIETKYIDTEVTGKNKRSRRTSHRKKVLAQALEVKEQLLQHWQIEPELCQCGVFTTDASIDAQASQQGIMARSIAIAELKHWQSQNN